MSATRESAGANKFEEEAAEVYFTHKRLGTLWLGQGDAATNGISETDLSGTGVPVIRRSATWLAASPSSPRPRGPLGGDHRWLGR